MNVANKVVHACTYQTVLTHHTHVAELVACPHLPDSASGRGYVSPHLTWPVFMTKPART